MGIVGWRATTSKHATHGARTEGRQPTRPPCGRRWLQRRASISVRAFLRARRWEKEDAPSSFSLLYRSSSRVSVEYSVLWAGGARQE